MHIGNKPNGNLRIFMDPRNLNKVILREHLNSQHVRRLWQNCREQKYFQSWVVQKDSGSFNWTKKCSMLCMFITPKDYQFGISSAHAIYHRTLREYRLRIELFENIQNMETSVDNIVIWGSDTKSHLLTVKKVLDICKSI